MSTSAIIEKWYHALRFPKEYDDAFYCALRSIEIDPSVAISDYDIKELDGKKNLLSFLYMCEQLEREYEEKGIAREILLDTLGDLVRWTQTWSDLVGDLCLRQLTWVSIPMKMQIFKLGRLQFCMQKTDHDVPQYGIRKGDDIIGIHIPAGEPLTKESCEKSIEMAREFFARYFPEYQYKYFTCHSWLLDTSLSDLFSKGSNILAFQSLFDIVGADRSDAIIRYVFRWEATREDLPQLKATSSFAKLLKEHLMDGREFYEGLGIIPR